MIPVKSVIQKIRNDRFAKNASILAGGTVIAQLLGILSLPLLTRLYTPDDFEDLAMFVAVLSIISAVACLRFEIAIPVAKHDKTAVELAALSLISTFLFFSITSVAVILIPDVLNIWTNNAIQGYLWLLPAGVLLSGCYGVFQYWSTRKRAFKSVAKTRIAQSTSGIITQIVFGFANVAPLGLILGQLLQSGSGVLSLGAKFFKESRAEISGLKASDLRRTFDKYAQYPTYSSLEALANTASVHLSIILIAVYTESAEAGFLFLIMKLLSVPMSLVGSSIAQVFLSEASEKYRQGELESFTRSTALALFKMGLPPIALISFGAPFLVPVFFGEEWSRAGYLMPWLAPSYLLQFVVSPIFMIFHITGLQKVAFVLQLSGGLFRSGCVFFSGVFFDRWIGEFFAVSGLVFYGVCIVAIFALIKKQKEIC